MAISLKHAKIGDRGILTTSFMEFEVRQQRWGETLCYYLRSGKSYWTGSHKQFELTKQKPKQRSFSNWINEQEGKKQCQQH